MVALHELAELTLQAGSVQDLAEHCARWSSRTVPGAATASVLLAWHRHPLAIAPSDPMAGRLTASASAFGGDPDPASGPAWQALSSGQVVAGTNLRCERRWGYWPVRALAAGVEAVYAYPLAVGHISIGVLTLFATTEAPLTLQARSWAAQVAAMIAVALGAAQRDFDHTATVEHLRTALTNRPVIDQAIGIILARNGGHPEAALTGLRKTSQKRNIPVRELAARLVAAASNAPVTVQRPAVTARRPGATALRGLQPER